MQIINGPLSSEEDSGDLSLYELMRTISRNFILAVGGIYLAFLIGTVFYPSERFTINVWIIFPLFLLIFSLSLRFHASNSIFLYLIRQSTYTLVLYIYEKAFRNFLLGDASATAYVLFFIMLGLTIVQFRLQKQWVNYELA